MLARLSVFAGGFTLQAVAAICLDGDDARALDLVGRLVESSLVVAESRRDVTRYRLLETIREYAAERLDASGSAEDVRRAHAEYFLDLANRARPDLTRFSRDQQRAYHELLDKERDNLHAAIRMGPGGGERAGSPARGRLATVLAHSGLPRAGPRVARGGARASRAKHPACSHRRRRGGRPVRAAHRRLRASSGVRRSGDRSRTPDRRAGRCLDRAQRPGHDRRDSRRLRACPHALRGVGRREPESRRHPRRGNRVLHPRRGGGELRSVPRGARSRRQSARARTEVRRPRGDGACAGAARTGLGKRGSVGRSAGAASRSARVRSCSDSPRSAHTAARRWRSSPPDGARPEERHASWERPTHSGRRAAQSSCRRSRRHGLRRSEKSAGRCRETRSRRNSRSAAF